MAGIGPKPKDPARRAGHSPRDPVPFRVVEVVPDRQPSLVEAVGEINPSTEMPWKPQTIRFWDQLEQFPTTSNLVGAQWTLLAAAMILMDDFLNGRTTAAAELRLELAKFGIAPDDVARLRIQFAQADTVEAAAPIRSHSARSRFGRVESDLPDVPELEA